MRGARRGDPEQSGNVYALFPGIDTTPFGDPGTTEESSGTDQGWSATPEPTITEATASASPRRVACRAGRRHLALGRSVIALGAAAVIGAGAGAARVWFSGITPGAPHVPAARAGAAAATLTSPNDGRPLITQAHKTELANSYAAKGAHRAGSRASRRKGHVAGGGLRRRSSNRAAVRIPTTATATSSPARSDSAPQTSATPAAAARPTSSASSRSTSAGNARTASAHGSTSTPFGENGTLGPGSSPDS
jgi:hypothetical protein